MAMYLGGATLVQADEYRQDNVETEGDEEENRAAAAGQVRQDRSIIGPLAQLKWVDGEKNTTLTIAVSTFLTILNKINIFHFKSLK